MEGQALVSELLDVPDVWAVRESSGDRSPRDGEGAGQHDVGLEAVDQTAQSNDRDGIGDKGPCPARERRPPVQPPSVAHADDREAGRLEGGAKGPVLGEHDRRLHVLGSLQRPCQLEQVPRRAGEIRGVTDEQDIHALAVASARS